MSIRIDHIIVAVADLEQASANYRDLGFTVLAGGKHASGATHNALICFADGAYIELLAPTGELANATGPDYTGLLKSEGLIGFALHLLDLPATVTAIQARGLAVDPIAAGGRVRLDGIQLAWSTALIESGYAPFLIADGSARDLRVPLDPASTTHANGVTHIRGIEILSADLVPTVERYRAIFGLAPEPSQRTDWTSFKLDRSAILLNQPSLEAVDQYIEKLQAAGEMFNRMAELSKALNEMLGEAASSKAIAAADQFNLGLKDEFALLRTQAAERIAALDACDPAAKTNLLYAVHLGGAGSTLTLDLNKAHQARWVINDDLRDLDPHRSPPIDLQAGQPTPPPIE